MNNSGFVGQRPSAPVPGPKKVIPATPSRGIKVGYAVRMSTGEKLGTVPLIRLSGKWLEQSGFCIGERVDVRVKHGEIALILLGPDDMSRYSTH